MLNATPAPLTCRFAVVPGACAQDDLSAFDFPWCESCPKSDLGKTPATSDPMKSAIWHGWINGIAGITK